jgi:phenylpyruvate tautomerase PptA (4-oxalocrotonate tautomerase family)
MPFVEVFASDVTDPVRALISERLVREVMEAEGAPDTGAARAISWLVWQEPEAWSIGGRPLEAGETPRYLIRVSVPAGSMDDAKRGKMVERITQVLVDAEGSERVIEEPAAWIHLVEIPEGNWGALGRVVRFPYIAEYVLTGSFT